MCPKSDPPPPAKPRPAAPALPEWQQEHLRRYQLAPADAHLWDAGPAGRPGVKIPTLLLTCTGRHSGEPRIAALTYGRVGANFVIVASRGGSSRHPSWYLNLQAEPRCHIQVGAERYRVRARTAAGSERATLWAHMLGVWPDYATYQARTAREIPVVVLEPAD